VLRSRRRQQTIHRLTDSASGATIDNISGMLRETRFFYASLYTPNPIDQPSVDELLGAIPSTVVLIPEDQNSLINYSLMRTCSFFKSIVRRVKAPG
ncbi:hypothetical protein BD560DRAFT_342339, partial [Blakeslea trispora]